MMASQEKTFMLLVTLVLISVNVCMVSSYQFTEREETKSDVMLMKILREYETDSHLSHLSFKKSDAADKKLLDLYMKGRKMDNDSICSCQNYTCGCCVRLDVEKIGLNDTACLNISYLPDEYGFEFEFILNGDVLIKEKISVKNPPPICAGIPYIKLASVCLRFYDLDFKNKQFSGCADVEVELEGVLVKKFDLGCFKIPPGQTRKSLNSWDGRIGSHAKQGGPAIPSEYQLLMERARSSRMLQN